METLKLIIKGFLIGVAKIIPGVSGAMLAISMGIYEKAMQAISEYRKNPIANFKFLLPLGIGGILAIILSSKVIVYFLNNYYLATMLLFIGLIFGGIPSVIKEAKIKKITLKHLFIFLLAFSFVFLFSFLGEQNLFMNITSPLLEKLVFIMIGFIDAVTMIVPGISGTAIMMILGCYHLLLNLLSSLSNVTSFWINLKLLIPMAIGLIIGIILTAKLMNFLFKKYKQETYCGILGFALSSILLLVYQTFQQTYSIVQVTVGIFLLLLGIVIGYKLDR